MIYQKDGASQDRLGEFMNELAKGCHKTVVMYPHVWDYKLYLNV